MNDPIESFNWSSIYIRYDAGCKGYGKTVSGIRPAEAIVEYQGTDRSLYYHLLRKIHSAKAGNFHLKPGLYHAVLYWKLYSSAPANPLKEWPREINCRSFSGKLDNLLGRLPSSEEVNRSKNKEEALQKAREMLRTLEGNGIMGMISGLAVKTTFLHFLYPHFWPIFDKQVLAAVGVTERDANRKKSILFEYIPHAWSLADKYGEKAKLQLGDKFQGETAVRLIDMALWVNRG